MLGAYQDSRPQGSEARKRARLGWPDLFVFAVYLFMAMPLPQIFRGITGGWAYPDRTSAGAKCLLNSLLWYAVACEMVWQDLADLQRHTGHQRVGPGLHGKL